MVESVLLPPTHVRPDGLKPGGWWTRKGERILCELCPRACLMKEGDRGFCFVRQNVDGEMVLTTYGHSTGFCIDPIEKKPLNHFLPGTAVLSFGTAGCNLGCKFCQNWSISKSREIEKLSESASPEAIAEAAVATGCRSVAFTYNDPVIWAEYAIDTAEACRQRGVKTVAVTAAYITHEARGPFFDIFDAANVDLKAFTEVFYHHLTLSHLEPVLDTIRWLKHETDTWFEITNLVIPDENDSPGELQRLCDWVLENVGDEVPVHFTAFHPDFRMQDKPRTPHETLISAREIALGTGLKYVYVGNVHDKVRQSTYCPGCQKLLVERDWHALGAWHLEAGCCQFCGTRIAGVFESQPGSWGRRRQPVDISRFTTAALDGGDQGDQGDGGGEEERLRKIDSLFSSNLPTVPSAAGPDEPAAELTAEQQQAVVAAAAEAVRATVLGRDIAWPDATLSGVAGRILSGAFVSLKRAGQLRSCCGLQGQPVRLDKALEHAAVRTASSDPRFPPVSPSELDQLDMEVWLLYGPQEVSVQGAERIEQVTIGRHGLQVVRGESRGLLLPGVATDHGWDAQQFLDQVCVKAQLPPTAWRESDTRLFTFEGDCLKGRLGDAPPNRPPPLSPAQVATCAEFCNNNIKALLQGGIASPYFSGAPDAEVQGLVLSTSWLGNASPIVQGRLAIRSSLPLQATLYELVEGIAARARATVGPRQQQGLTTHLLVLSDTALHGSNDAVDLAGADRGDRAMVVTTPERFAMCWDRQSDPGQLLEQARREAQLAADAPAAVYSIHGEGTDETFTLKRVPVAVSDTEPRQPAVAGRFYPAEADQLEKQVDGCFAEIPEGPTAAWSAAMVPHAGLKFSGHVAAATLARLEVPEQVIIIGPKHTSLGLPWAVAPHAAWELPGGSVASDPVLATGLADAIEGLQLDAAAHRDEHGIEVILPLLRRVAPSARVVGIVIGSGEGELEACRRFAEQLAAFLEESPQPPLLLISSDMNHFAGDEENRRLDALTLEAMETLDPERLLKTVRDNQISMCGVLPAVIVIETLKRLGRLSRIERTGYATSADTTGDPSRVVGYAGMLLG